MSAQWVANLYLSPSYEYIIETCEREHGISALKSTSSCLQFVICNNEHPFVESINSFLSTSTDYLSLLSLFSIITKAIELHLKYQGEV